MDETKNQEFSTTITAAIDTTLENITQEREREIVSRRFGLRDRKETLEQIGELLGITRERVRQLEKAVVKRLKETAAENELSAVSNVEKLLIRDLSEHGRAGRTAHIAERLAGKTGSKKHVAHIAFIAELSPKLTVVNDNDKFHHSIVMSHYGNEKEVQKHATTILQTVKKHGEPLHIEALHDLLDYEHPSHVKGIASISKQLTHLNDHWGLLKWPTVNPRNIRDKIFVILSDNKKPMHFGEIADSIRTSGFKRNKVTTQAIHNELIKDKRFVLIGRGIYALNSWGYSKGTVAEIIADVLQKAEGPLHRDEIVERVLKRRQVKNTTILLNLQSKPQFKRVAKATYTFDASKLPVKK